MSFDLPILCSKKGEMLPVFGQTNLRPFDGWNLGVEGFFPSKLFSHSILSIVFVTCSWGRGGHSIRQFYAQKRGEMLPVFGEKGFEAIR